jgi:hypothetical protein
MPCARVVSSGNPYRAPAEPVDDDDGDGQGQASFDVDVLVALAFLWIASVVRVASAFVRHEAFGAEPTVAFLVVLALPWLTRGSIARVWQMRRPAARFARRTNHASPHDVRADARSNRDKQAPISSGTPSADARPDARRNAR